MSFDKTDCRVFLEFNNGSRFSFLTSQVEELANLPLEVLAEVALLPGGKGLSWKTPNIDLSIQGLLINNLGSKKWMTQIGRLAGKAKTESKITATREVKSS